MSDERGPVGADSDVAPNPVVISMENPADFEEAQWHIAP